MLKLLTAYEHKTPFPVEVVSEIATAESIQSFPSLFVGEPQLLGVLFDMPEFVIYQEGILLLLNESQQPNLINRLTRSKLSPFFGNALEK